MTVEELKESDKVFLTPAEIAPVLRSDPQTVVNPIIDWQDEDVYGFREDARCPMNPLYEEGQLQVGCVGCPMAGKKGREAQPYGKHGTV